jgi:hypothetical protein
MKVRRTEESTQRKNAIGRRRTGKHKFKQGPRKQSPEEEQEKCRKNQEHSRVCQNKMSLWDSVW